MKKARGSGFFGQVADAYLSGSPKKIGNTLGGKGKPKVSAKGKSCGRTRKGK